MNVQLIQPGHRQFVGTADLNKYHWYATRDGKLVRGSIGLKQGRPTPHEISLHLGEHEARYIGVFTRDYVALPQCEVLREAIAKVWKAA